MLAAIWSPKASGGFRTTVQAMAFARLERSLAYEELDAQVVALLAGMRPNPTPSMQAALRTAIVMGRDSREPALALWLPDLLMGR